MVSQAPTGLAFLAESMKKPAATNKEQTASSFIAFQGDLYILYSAIYILRLKVWLQKVTANDLQLFEGWAFMVRQPNLCTKAE
jgi:hypothetical protein